MNSSKVETEFCRLGGEATLEWHTSFRRRGEMALREYPHRAPAADSDSISLAQLNNVCHGHTGTDIALRGERDLGVPLTHHIRLYVSGGFTQRGTLDLRRAVKRIHCVPKPFPWR